MAIALKPLRIGPLRPEWPLWAAIAVSFVALLAGGLFAYSSLRTMADAHSAAFDAVGLMKGVRELQFDIYVADSNLEGYAEFPDDSFKSRYKTAVDAVPPELAALRSTARDPEQRARITRLGQLVDAHLAMLEESEAAARDGAHRPAELIRRTLANMEAINATIQGVRTAELTRMARINDQAANSYHHVVRALLVSAALTILLLSAAAALFRRELKRRMSSEAQAVELNGALEERVSERTAQLSAVTSRLETETATLRNINDQLNEIVRHAPLGIVNYSAEMRLNAWNPASERIFGFSAQEMVGRPLEEAARLVGADPDELRSFARGVLSGQSLEAVTAKRRRKDGRPITVRLWGARHGVLGDDQEGFVFLVEDVSERAALEERLQLDEYAIENASMGMILTLPDARIVRVNPSLCRLVGHSEADLRSMKIADVSPSLPESVWQAHWSELRTRRSMTLMSELQHRDGHLVPVEIDASLLRFQGMEVHVSLVRDMTLRRQIEAQLIQAQKMESVGKLAGGIAHDFNNLLGVIMGNIEIALENAQSDRELSGLLQAALGAAQRGANLTHQMLAFSRKQPLKPRLLNVRDSLTQLNELLHRTLGESIRVRVKLADGLWSILVDPTQFDTTVLNLVVNARDAMANGGDLTIAAHNCTLDADYVASHPEAREGDFVCLEVTDTGTGMSSEVLARVFDPFFTTKPAGKGTGLGLSMVYGFVRQSDGHIAIYSEPGRGTTVRTYLPAVTPIVGLDKDRRIAAVDEPSGHERILVVEDDDNVRKIACNQLRQLGYSVVETDNGPAALDILRSDSGFDLLFTDVVMQGGMSGIDLRNAVRREQPDLPVLLTSGFPDLGQMGFQIGSDDLLISKPYRRQELAENIRLALSQRRTTV